MIWLLYFLALNIICCGTQDLKRLSKIKKYAKNAEFYLLIS